MYVIPHSYPYLTEKSKQVIQDCLEQEYVGYDASIDEQIAKEFSSYLSFEYINTTPSASVALMIILKSLHLSKKDEVIVSSINCWSVYNMVQQEGGTPVLCDVRTKSDFRASYTTIKDKITPRTRGVIINHMYGNMIEEDALKKIKEEYPNVCIIEDFSTSIFSNKTQKIGKYSDFAISSFGSTKPLTGGIGGLLAGHHQIVNFNYSSRNINDKYISFNIKLSRLNQMLILQQIRDYHNYKKMKKDIVNFYSKFVKVYKENTDDLFRAVTFDKIDGLVNFLKNNGICLDVRNSVQPNLTKAINQANNPNALFFKEYFSLPLNSKAYSLFVSIGVIK